jgi:HEPN domain-containing protein
MIDIARQVTYWRTGSEEDWAVASDLVKRGRTRHGLFFVHLAVEKALKAHVCRKTQNMAPRTHNLLRLAAMAGLDLSEKHKELLGRLNAFAVEGRYPETLPPMPTEKEARAYLSRVEEVLTWLISQL